MIRTCPGYERYGIDQNGEIVSCCRGSWKILNPAKGTLSLHGERTISCKIGKFRYCVENKISPAKISFVGALVTNDGKLWTKSDFRSEMNKRRKSMKCAKKADNIQRLLRTIEMAQAAIAFIKGDSAPLLLIMESERPRLVNSLYCNKALAQEIVAEAELQLLEALPYGTVADPSRWLYKRAKGILLDQTRRVRTINNTHLV